MTHLVEAVRRSITEKNWYAALAGALLLPDVAARIDGRPGQSGARFAAWFDDYLLPAYTVSLPDGPEIFLSGNDCYALRCAYLHEGDFDIFGQSARNLLDRFHFVVQVSGMSQHCNLVVNNSTVPPTKVLQLRVDRFCEDVCAAVEKWLQARGSDPSVQAAIARLPWIEAV